VVWRVLKTKMKKVLVISDLHCGHRSGLTPQWWNPRVDPSLWNWYQHWVKAYQADILICCGDMTEGMASRSAGSELLYHSWQDQTDMATQCILETGCKRIIMVHGTPYHTAGSEDGHDHENTIARTLSDMGHHVTIGSHEWPLINGIQFDIKHKVGSSSTPYGRFTPLAKEHSWNLHWHAFNGSQPKAHVFLRGHVHDFRECSGADWIAMSLPNLTDWGNKYGERQCSGLVTTGLTWFNILPDDDVSTMRWGKIIYQNEKTQKVQEYLV